MAPDNDNVVAPTGGLTKTPTKSSGKWRNLILIGAGMAALAGGSGWIGFGVGYNVENKPTLGSALRTQSRIVVPLMVHEKYAGEFALGGSGQALTGLTADGTLMIESGAILMGASPYNFTVSGSNVRIGGGVPIVGVELAVVGDISGSTLKVDGLGGATLTSGAVPCIKTGGLIGWMQRTATGTLKPTCN